MKIHYYSVEKTAKINRNIKYKEKTAANRQFRKKQLFMHQNWAKNTTIPEIQLLRPHIHYFNGHLLKTLDLDS